MNIKDLDKHYIDKKMEIAAMKEWTKAESYIQAVRLGWKAARRLKASDRSEPRKPFFNDEIFNV